MTRDLTNRFMASQANPAYYLIINATTNEEIYIHPRVAARHRLYHGQKVASQLFSVVYHETLDEISKEMT